MRNMLLAALMVSAPALCVAADWHPGVVHLHSTYSDGVLSPHELAAAVRLAGGEFMVVTDHYNNIGQELKIGTPLSIGLTDVFHNHGGPWGFAEYADTVSRLTTPGEFVAIPGAEIGAKWEPEPGNEASSHTLAIGTIDEPDSQVLDEYCEKAGGQQHIINKIRQWGMLPVAAHPSMLLDGRSGKLSLTGRIDYRYDKRPAAETADVDGNYRDIQYKGLAGVELFNAPNSEQCQSDIDFYLRLIREGYKPFVTAGSDYHGYKPSETASLGRQTWVYAADLTAEGLLRAMSEGRTCAAQHGARLVSMRPMPGEHVQSGDSVVKATVEFPTATTSEKLFVVYRDGVEAPGSRQTKPAGPASYDYEWTDAAADGKEHSYVLRVGEVLVTSPGYATGLGPATEGLLFLRDNQVMVADPATWTSRVLAGSKSRYDGFRVAGMTWALPGGRIVVQPSQDDMEGGEAYASLLLGVSGEVLGSLGDGVAASADGTTFASSADASITVSRLVGEQLDIVKRLPQSQRGYGLSPDGRRVAVATITDDPADVVAIHSLDVDAGTVQTFSADQGGGPHSPSWSSTGRFIAYGNHATGGGAGIGVYDTDGGEDRALTDWGGQSEWCPTSDRLAVVSWERGVYANEGDRYPQRIEGRMLVLAAPDWEEECSVPCRDAGMAQLAWSPNGTHVAVLQEAGDGPGDRVLEVISLADQHSRPLAKGPIVSMAWSPDAAMVAVTTCTGWDDLGHPQAPFAIEVRNAGDGSTIARLDNARCAAWLGCQTSQRVGGYY